MDEITFEFACRDDCLQRMVPSDLRVIVRERDDLRKRVKELEFQINQEEWRGEPQLYELLTKAVSTLNEVSEMIKENEHLGDKQIDRLDNSLALNILQTVEKFEQQIPLYDVVLKDK